MKRYILLITPGSSASSNILELLRITNKREIVEIVDFKEDPRTQNILETYNNIAPGIIFDTETKTPLQGEELASLLGIKLISK